MKVWVVEISDFLPVIDGDNRLYRAGMLAKALVDEGHEVLWWSSTFNHQLRRQRFSTSTTVEINNKYCLRLLYGPGYRSSTSIRRWIHNRTVAKEFVKEINSKPIIEYPDIIYTCMPTLEVCEQVVLFGKRNGIPVVVDIREQLPKNYLLIIPSFFRPIFRITLANEFIRARRIMKNAAGITASSAAYLKFGLDLAQRCQNKNDSWFPLCPYIKSLGDNEATSNQPFSLHEELNINNTSLIITFVGALSRLIDLKSVVSVAYELNASVNKVDFVFVGDGEQKGFLEKHGQIIKNIHVMGWCDKPVVDKILASSAIGLAPYSSTLAPTLPNKPFEYMAAGLPLLSSLEGELKTIIEQDKIGLQYKASNPTDLLNKILWFLSNPEETKAMGHRAKELFKKMYNADVVYPNFVKHLYKITAINGD